MKKTQTKNRVSKNFIFICISVFIHLLFFVSFSNLSMNYNKGTKNVLTLKINRIANKNLLPKKKKELPSKKIHKGIKKSKFVKKPSQKKITSRKSNIRKKRNLEVKEFLQKNKIKKISVPISKMENQRFKKSELPKIVKNKSLSLKTTNTFKKNVKRIDKKRNLKKIVKQIKIKKKTKQNKKVRVFKAKEKTGIIIVKKRSELSIDAIKREISQKIQQKQIYLYPPIAIRNGIQGVTKVVFKIMPDGNLQKISIRKSSGNIFLDKASLEAVSSATPFPYLKDPLKISVRWRIEN